MRLRCLAVESPRDAEIRSVAGHGPALRALLAAWIALAALFVPGSRDGVALADEPASLVLAREVVDRCRGESHRTKMRVIWPAITDETPPDGAEVVLVRGYMSYQMTRMVLRGGKVEAGSVAAARSWFYNQEEGEGFAAQSFEVDAGQFVRAWNAMRRILAASDERIEPEPAEHERTSTASWGSHDSVDWIRVRAAEDVPPLHCADGAIHRRNWEGVRSWNGIRDQAVFEMFRALLPTGDAAARPAVPVAAWSVFALEEIHAAARAPDRAQIDRDHAFLGTCLRILGVAGDVSAEAAVAAFATSLAGLGDARPWLEGLREEASFAATRLRIRHHWDRDDVVRTLRAAPDGTWARGDQAKWLRQVFREKDPRGWASFLVEEVTREGAGPDDVAAAAADLKALPAAESVPLLRALLPREDPYVRLEAALALLAFDAKDESAKSAIVKLALDRSVECFWRADLTNRWSRYRALRAALDKGWISAKELHAHVVAPEPDDPAFLRAASAHLAKTPEPLTHDELRDAWRRLLGCPRPGRVTEAVRRLVEMTDVASKERMLAALDRLDARIAEVGEEEAEVRADAVATLRETVRRLGEPEEGGK